MAISRRDAPPRSPLGLGRRAFARWGPKLALVTKRKPGGLPGLLESSCRTAPAAPRVAAAASGAPQDSAERGARFVSPVVSHNLVRDSRIAARAAGSDR